ncbi:MAG TPA: CAP domain-containing protein [Mucilaginibacter sp.]
MMKRLIYPVMCAAICFASCKKNSVDPAKTTDTTSTPVVSTVNTGLDNTAMLKLVNDTRAAGCTCGTTVMPPVSPLKWNDVLATAALSHSKDMNTTGVLDHNSSDGTSFSARISSFGYKWRTVGENIAWGQTTEQQVFTDWINSEGHCMNIMNGSFKDFGAAKAGVYWTQDFGAQQ